MRTTLVKTALSVALAACASLALAQEAKPADYRLGPGDSIKVQVYQNPDLTVEARVSESGSVNYPLVGGLNIGGLSIAEAESRIASALKAGKILKDPQVNIVLQQVRGNQVSVLGQVHRPGRFPLEAMNVRVSDMLAAAGGVSATGDDRVVVSGMRDGKQFRKEIDINAMFAGTRSSDDILLAAGDTIYVSKAPMYYIYGEAQRPGPYRVERGMTVMQAIAAGGGVTPRGSENRLRLHRAAADGNVQQMTPRLTDVVQPGDVLFVRESIF
jgi:polysaccharide export outer membrane protein